MAITGTPGTLSVIIITKNEERCLRSCLESVAWADEIVLVDSGSDDRTCAIAREFTDRVYVEDWHGFGPQKNLALSRATGRWVLSIDADEVVTEPLAVAIREVISSAEHVGYWIARRSRFCGREMRFGDWARDHVLRLFQRERARFTDDAVHEQVKVEGSTGRLRPHLQHDALRSPHEVLRKIDQYSELWAAEAHERGRRCSYASALGHGAWTFIRSGILLGGFLDGPLGIALAIAAAEGAYYRYMKLYQLSREGSENGR